MKDIAVNNLWKRYGEKQVLRGFSAVFRGGETSCIMGRSGCGKTTLLQILLGLEKADAGSVTGMPKRISAVFQEDRLCEEMSAVGNIRLVTGKSVAESEMASCLDAFGLSRDKKTRVSEMSGGMKRRVAIARALLAPGELLIMDEPFKGLDEATRADVAETIAARLNGRTLIFVTHSPEEAAFFDAKVIRMEET